MNKTGDSKVRAKNRVRGEGEKPSQNKIGCDLVSVQHRTLDRILGWERGVGGGGGEHKTKQNSQVGVSSS